MEIHFTVVDGGGHLLRTNTLFLGMCKRLSFVLIWLATPKILNWTQNTVSCLGTRNGANDHEQPRSVPLGST